MQQLRSAQIILTTPEKWDSATRNWRDNQAFMRSVSLFLIDEVHLLNDKQRGATLEAVVSRMKVTITSAQQTLKRKVRRSSNTADFISIPKCKERRRKKRKTKKENQIQKERGKQTENTETVNSYFKCLFANVHALCVCVYVSRPSMRRLGTGSSACALWR